LQILGPPVLLDPQFTTSFALALHELATNAVKYGSWRSAKGTVTLEWRHNAHRVYFRWRERGDEIAPPAKTGFGSTLIRKGLGGAQVRHLFKPNGVECTIIAQMPRC